MVSSTVVICAYTVDRWEDLQQAADTACGGDVIPDQLIVVIDHNDVLLARARHHFNSRGINAVEAIVVPNAHKRGLSGARNTAIQHATHDVIVFLDDDASATTTWLGQLLTRYTDERVIGVGGSAEPVWPEGSPGRPALLPAIAGGGRGVLDWIVGCTYEGQPESVTAVRNLMGCNMSFRRTIFKHISPFSEDLGRIGKTPLGGEETEFCIRARQFSPASLIVFDPAAVVRHRVSPDRVRWKYLVSRGYGEGLSKAVVATLVGQDAALESEKSYVTDVLGRALRGQLRLAFRGQIGALVGAAAIVTVLTVTTVGYLRGSIHQHRLRAGELTNAAA